MSRSVTSSPPPSPVPDRLSDFRADRRMLLLCVLAPPLGVIGAFVAQALLWLIAVLTNAAFFLRLSAEPVELAGHHFGWPGVLPPIVGGLIIGLMARYGSEKIRGHGIPEALEAILLGRSLIKPRVAILKPVSSAVSIGTGGPFGAEGPIIMTGGACGSLFAQLFHLSAAERKTLLVAGAAAGMAAVFATPLAAVLLAVELLLFEWRPRSFIPVAIAALIASLVRVPLLGAGPIFPVPAHGPIAAGQLPVALLVGLGVGAVSVLLTLLVYACEDGFDRLPLHWSWWPALGGLAVGLGGLVDSRVLGVGYDLIHQLLRGDILPVAAATLIAAKGIVWAAALGSGTSGGVLAPVLMIGGATGAVVGQLSGSGQPGLWAMVGMAAMMGGTMNAPLTGLFFALELTHDFNALPALLVGTVAAFGVSVLGLRRSILTEKLARRGQHIAREYSVDVFERVRVAEAMDEVPPVVAGGTTVREFNERLAAGEPALTARQGTLLADDAGRLAGILTRSDLLRALRPDAPPGLTVLEAGTRQVVTVRPDATLHDAIGLMLKHGIGRLAVVDAADPGRIVGYLGRGDIIAARAQILAEEEHRERGPFLR